MSEGASGDAENGPSDVIAVAAGQIGSGRFLEPPVLVVEQTSDTQGGVCIAVAGEIDMANFDPLRTVVLGVLAEPGVVRLTVDLGGVTFMDTAGVQTFVDARQLAESRRVSFAMVNARGTVLRVLQVLSLDQVLTGKDQLEAVHVTAA